MWETIELREARTFLALASELHLGRTAERLDISQPAVTQAIKSLEQQLGVRLFDRSSRRVALTADGRRLQSKLTARPKLCPMRWPPPTAGRAVSRERSPSPCSRRSP
jgi:DNA-binding MarR family transcriptional regulator